MSTSSGVWVPTRSSASPRKDFTAGASGYDLVFQLGGTYSPAAVRRVLTPHGTLIQSFGDGGRWFGPMGNMIKAAVLNRFIGQTLKAFTATVTAEALHEIKGPHRVRTHGPGDRPDLPDRGSGRRGSRREGSPPGKVVVLID